MTDQAWAKIWPVPPCPAMQVYSGALKKTPLGS